MDLYSGEPFPDRDTSGKSGIIFNIQRYSIHDGPGIRTVVFLKGCPLRCVWCDNPESQKPSLEVVFYQHKCIMCGRCNVICKENAINKDLTVGSSEKIDRSLCNNCMKCVKECISGALNVIGERMTVTDVLNEVLRDKPFYKKSGGGVTVSGGEPLSQPEFARNILKASYDHSLHTAIETTGYSKWRIVERILEFADLILYDLKQLDDSKHRELTGVSNKSILENLEKIMKSGKRVIVRYPLIPDCNTSSMDILRLGEYLSEIKVSEVDILPFHQYGKSKYPLLNMQYGLYDVEPLDLSSDGKKLLEDSAGRLRSYGLKVRIGG
jgi:pyruvate formate lyase activating enzyme